MDAQTGNCPLLIDLSDEPKRRNVTGGDYREDIRQAPRRDRCLWRREENQFQQYHEPGILGIYMELGET